VARTDLKITQFQNYPITNFYFAPVFPTFFFNRSPA